MLNQLLWPWVVKLCRGSRKDTWQELAEMDRVESVELLHRPIQVGGPLKRVLCFTHCRA